MKKNTTENPLAKQCTVRSGFKGLNAKLIIIYQYINSIPKTKLPKSDLIHHSSFPFHRDRILYTV